MKKWKAFQKIRKEDAILWIGAGCSISSGFPSGKKLAGLFHSELSEEEKKIVDSHLSLPDLAEQFYQIHGHNKVEVHSFLKEIFLKPPIKEVSLHEKIASIPHIRTIITTNYDRLFENAYGEKGQVITKSIQIPQIERNKTQIFKIHGDLSEPDNLIITTSDYNRFFSQDSEESVYWGHIKNFFSSHSIIFMGYSLEDSNVSVLFDKIHKQLKDYQKECFLVSPKLPKHKIQDLMKKGVQYIDMTAEEFIEDLLLDIRNNILSDFENGWVGVETVHSVLGNHYLRPNLESKEGKIKVRGYSSTDGELKGELKFDLNESSNSINDEIRNFLLGNKIGKLELSSERVDNLQLYLNGIRMPSGNKIKKLQFISAPIIESTCDIRFDDGLEFNSVDFKVYKAKEKIEIHVDLQSGKIKIELGLPLKNETRIMFNYEPNSICYSVADVIDHFVLMQKLSEKELFSVFYDSDFPVMDSVLINVDFRGIPQKYLTYLRKLKRIENYFQIKFRNIDLKAIGNYSMGKVDEVILAIEGGKKEANFEEGVFKLFPDPEIVNILEWAFYLNDNQKQLTSWDQDVRTIQLHGKNLRLGYPEYIIHQPYIDNFDDIFSGRTKEVKIKSKINKIERGYSPTKKNES